MKPTLRIFTVYMLIIVFTILANSAFGQITVKHFNAEWNKSNAADWFMDLKDCKTKGYVDIAKNTKAQTEHKIAVVPTIIIFKDGEEVARFQADLSFKMAKELNEDTGFNISIKTLIGIGAAMATIISMWFMLQADIAEARELPEPPEAEVTRMEFDMKDQMIRQTIMTTQEDVKEIKEDMLRIEQKIDKLR